MYLAYIMNYCFILPSRNCKFDLELNPVYFVSVYIRSLLNFYSPLLFNLQFQHKHYFCNTIYCMCDLWQRIFAQQSFNIFESKNRRHRNCSKNQINLTQDTRQESTVQNITNFTACIHTVRKLHNQSHWLL